MQLHIVRQRHSLPVLLSGAVQFEVGFQADEDTCFAKPAMPGKNKEPAHEQRTGKAKSYPPTDRGAARAPDATTAVSDTQNAEEWNYLWRRRTEVRVRALMNRLYQQERQRHMEWREGIVKVSSLVLGSVAVASVANPCVLKVAGVATFACSASSLVFGWGSKARDAARRASDWAALERDIESVGERGFSEPQINAWVARCNDIEATEPAPNRRMLDAAYLRACEVTGSKPCEEDPPPRKRIWTSILRWVPAVVIP